MGSEERLEWIPRSHRTVGAALERNAWNFGSRMAVRDVSTNTSWTFQEFDQRVNRAAEVLSKQFGVSPGERVLLVSANHPEMLTLFFALSRLGAITVPLPPRATTRERKTVLDDCSPSLALVERNLMSRVQEGAAGPRLVGFGGDEPGDFERWMERARGDLPRYEVGEHDPAFIVYTGGSTGRPKGVVQSQANYCASADNTIALLAPTGIGRSDGYLSVLPLFHAAGWGLCFAFLYYGMPVHVVRQPEPAVVASELASGAVTVICAVPTLSRRLLDHASEEKLTAAHFDPCRVYISTTGPSDRRLRGELKKRFRRAAIVNSLGQTELTGGLMALTEARQLSNAPDSLGLPVPGVAVSIIDTDGSHLGVGEVGEICYKGELVMLGYWRQPAETMAAFRDGWFASGDLGRRGDDGAVHLVGRAKDVIISGGLNVYAGEIEATIARIRGVRDVCVVGVPEEQWGEQVVAVLVLSAEEGPVAGLIERVERRCREEMSPYKVPKRWVVAESLPMTAVGKLDRGKARELALQPGT